MQAKGSFEAKFSDAKGVSASFADYIINNEIERNKLLSALNASEFICNGKDEKVTLSIDELSKALTDIDGNIKANYKILRPDDLGNILDKYSVSRKTTSGTPLSNSQILIYESLILLFEAEFQTSSELKDKKTHFDMLCEGNHTEEMLRLQSEIHSLTREATRLFAQELHKTDTKIHANVFTKLYGFFNTSSLSRDIVIGTVIGLLIAGAIAGAIIASVGTAGIGPLVFGAAAAATLGSVGTGLSLGAIGIGIVGFFTASFAAVGEYFRSETTDDPDKQTGVKVMHPVMFNNQFAGIIGSTNPSQNPVTSQTVDSPDKKLFKESMIQPKDPVDDSSKAGMRLN